MSTNEAQTTQSQAPQPNHANADPMPHEQQQMNNNNDGAPSALALAIDEFLGDLERKFKTVSDEILTKLDDMAERCDRIEAELLMRDAAGAGTSKSSLDEKSES